MVFKVKDHYYKKAKSENYLARSIYKLEEIDKKYNLFEEGQIVLDLGYYPGSWTQYVSKVIGEEGKVVGIDIQPVNTKMKNQKNIKLYEKDINEVTDLSDLEVEEKFDIVISDMAPKTTGIKSVDQARSLGLVEMTMESLEKFLKEGGDFVIKVFESNDAQVFLKTQKKRFKQFNYLRPKSTRSVSKEFFVIAKGFIK